MLKRKTNHKRKYINHDIDLNLSEAYNNPNRPNKNLLLEGERFGKLVITNFLGFTLKDEKPIYQYKCDCGNIGVNIGNDLSRKIKENPDYVSTCGSCPTNYFELINNDTVLGYTDTFEIFIINFLDFQNLNIFNFNWAIDSNKDDGCDNIRYYIISKGYNHRTMNNISNSPIRLHSYIIGLSTTSTNIITDHVHNERGYDNRRKNLRVVTPQQNTFNTRKYSTNTTGITGIYFDKTAKNKPWYARIRVDGKHIFLGNANTKEELIPLRLEAEEKYFGKFNHVEEDLKTEDNNDEVIQLLLKRNFINKDGLQNPDAIKIFINNHNFEYLKLNKIEDFNSNNLKSDLAIINK